MLRSWIPPLRWGHRRPASSTSPGGTGQTGTALTTSFAQCTTVARTTRPLRTSCLSTSLGGVPKVVLAGIGFSRCRRCGTGRIRCGTRAWQLKQQRDPYKRISKHLLPQEEKKRSAKKDFRAIPDGIEVLVAAYPITYWVMGGWTASELADTDHCQQGPFLSVRKFDSGGATHFKP
uniref:Uncharacterized protein n=1 Tax=Chromera velia CCMP2878 TaxID=1169474 RepID=A0A0G4IA25_9ALVE|eukprot:Cvel_12339.t1-p1 / transcript=Cvel_12339.t1 / gene=Cvel_12339 / organism=Chromera_velia_CCMP2878 / gene_product=hypothetical protein / transcript_product=hypothetical protein / location=Cvel_scaffold803:15455-15979(-) / protein_length=175 / sequence_SO=supercontig / SO=protein_coding / is_pseudo=false